MSVFHSTNPPIRTLGFYQPYGELMLHDKTETRWVMEGKKPPFPLGKYLFYTTKRAASAEEVQQWSGAGIYLNSILPTLGIETVESQLLCGYAIATAELLSVNPLQSTDENTFVKFVGKKTETVKDKSVTKIQWALTFHNVQAIKPFPWLFGKQGVGFVPDSELHKIIPSIHKKFRHGKEKGEVICV